MPFKSKAQMRKLAVLEKSGKIKQGTLNRWAIETPNIKKLPERAHNKKTERGNKK